MGVFKRDFNTSNELKHFRKQLAFSVNETISEAVKENFISKPTQLHYYLLNLNARELKNQCLVDKNLDKVRLNFAPHAYLWPHSRFGQEIKSHVLAAIYTSSEGRWLHSSLCGIDECTDNGRISINPQKFISNANKQEVHLHQSDE